MAWDYGNDGMRSEVVEADAMEVVDDPVTLVTAKHPLNTNARTPDPITDAYVESQDQSLVPKVEYVNVCYGRSPPKQEQMNYSYPCTLSKSKQDIFLDVRGEFTLAEGCEYLGFESVGMVLSIEGGVAFFMSEVTERHFVSVAGSRKVKFGFPTAWNSVIPSSAMAGSEPAGLDVQIVFSYRDSRQDPPETRSGVVMMSSESPEDDRLAGPPHFAKLDPVKLNWGCVAAGSMVLMADGSEKRVEDLAVGDMVSDGGSAHRVADVRRGSDDVTVMITSGDMALRVSTEHPVLTGRGMVRACDVRSDDVLVTADGEVAPDSAYHFVGTVDVYGVMLEDGHRFVCDGFVVGDDSVQGEVMAGNRVVPEPSEDILREVEVLKARLL